MATPDRVTVGPFVGCDYVTDGVDDGATVNTAWAAVSANGTVELQGDLYVDLAAIHLDNTQFPTANHYLMRTKTLTSLDNARVHLNTASARNLIEVHGAGIAIENLQLDGKHLDTDMGTIYHSGCNGIYIIDGTNLRLTNLVIQGTGDAGIRIAETASYITGYREWSNLYISLCYTGFTSYGMGDTIINNMVIANPRSYCVDFRKYAGYTKFSNCHFWQGGNALLNEAKRQQYFWDWTCSVLLGGFGYNQFDNCEFDSYNYYAVYNWEDTSGGWAGHTGGHNLYTNCRFDGGCPPVGGASYAYPLCILTDYNVVTGNKFEDAIDYLYYQVYIESGALYNVIDGNVLYSKNRGHGNSCIYNNGGSTNKIGTNA